MRESTCTPEVNIIKSFICLKYEMKKKMLLYLTNLLIYNKVLYYLEIIKIFCDIYSAIPPSILRSIPESKSWPDSEYVACAIYFINW